MILSRAALRRTALIARREVGRVWGSALGPLLCASSLALFVVSFYTLALGLRARPAAALLQDAYGLAAVCVGVSALLVGMRTFAQERERGAMAMLDALPISSAELVAGKLMGAWLASWPLQLLPLTAAALLAAHAPLDVAQLATSSLGLALLQLSCLAVAVCASALSATQLGAALYGGVWLVALLLMWWIARVVEPPWDAWLAALSLYDRRFRAFTEGRVRLQDVAYYVGLSAMAAGWAWRALALRRHATREASALVRALVISALMSCGALGGLALAAHHDVVWGAVSAQIAPSEPTRRAASALADVRAALFVAPTAELRDEHTRYLTALVGADRLEILDARVDVGRARELGVEDNGVVALWTQGAPVQRLLVGERRGQGMHRGIDGQVRRALAALALGPRVIYVLGGHGELDRSAARDERQRAVALWSLMREASGAEVAPLSLWSAEARVPDDAALVVVLAPTTELLAHEQAALEAYVERGGALWLAGAASSGLMASWASRLGWAVGQGELCASGSFVPSRLALSDRRDLVTRSFAVTPALGPLGVPGVQDAVLWPQSGWFERRGLGGAGSGEAVVYSPPDAWAEQGAECVREGSEAQGRRAVAVLGGVGRGRVALLGSAQVVSDFGLLRGQGNKLLAAALTRWLIAPEVSDEGAISGWEQAPVTISAGVRRAWLWGAGGAVPLCLLGAAAVRARRRRR
jgi:ABC-2 type transport system permease protein